MSPKVVPLSPARSTNAALGAGAPHNPFASARVQPGALPFLLPTGQPATHLFREFCELGSRAQVLGPHGSGKSTLLHHLAAEARRSGWRVAWAQQGKASEALPSGRQQRLVVVDGAEQWSARTWRRLESRCARTDSRLLAATHADLGWPTLWHATVTVETAQQVVAHLLRDEATPLPSETHLRTLVEQHNGNLRLALFALYDWFEQRRQSKTPDT
ncbi:MAG: hypothetical protein COZ06_21020 [Armatimonadetes bacterium CG_4_10_14_3_um_filter_66_18]|nr:MAG: hypothetical protein COS65_15840 [Armatimonadetes bacterium CG06_land_8_20_14_3_00_66_21]PIX38573.1 MAG: hypothetical protein COZ57_30260 [Armatimonadetes bacterium CG_4_8_14_3_um_filter_66_20]PIY44230.1 MAG: hypothetical protein COZ06_21020 [Armatimonadetes bacterium CG_4_10_14_3_um_filter_66_18]PIZ45964.1 MAG: hypothetical protein COY42_11345 [Armatimonadetes bacterium CG_4_10_14_0_8_um_filter_66_14]PJB72241.1 MAG: hypothetical protein CO096_08200 [Armatimonadetes bacterium CG_4_9_14_